MMQFRNDSALILQRAWSIRLMLIAGVLSGAEVALPVLGDPFHLPSGVFAALSGLTTAAAFVARLIVQKGLNNGQREG